MEGYVYSESITFPEIAEHEIAQAVAKSAPNKAPGEDGILNRIIKLPIITPP